jgi:hypothetical protein
LVCLALASYQIKKIRSDGRGNFAAYRAAAGPNFVVHVMVWASQVSLKCRHIS